MTTNDLNRALEVGTIEWRSHALKRMLQRGISQQEVKEAIRFGEIIEEYPNDRPFESVLVFYRENKCIHVVISLDNINQIIYVITAYIPDTVHFENDLKTRRKNG